MVTEKRTYRRFDIDGNAKVVMPDYGARVVKAYLDDISLGGFQAYALDKANVGDKVDFELTTPLYHDTLPGKGRIRHIRPVTKYNMDCYSLGVEFSKVEKQKVTSLIKLPFSRRKKPGFFETHRKELVLYFFLLPFMIALCWVGNDAINSANYSAAQEKASADKFNDAMIYYLYHSH